MKYLKRYKIFEDKQDFENLVQECFIPVEDLTNVRYKYGEHRIYQCPVYHSVLLTFYFINSDALIEIADALSHCVGMGLTFQGGSAYTDEPKPDNFKYNMNTHNGFCHFSKDDIDKFYNFAESFNKVHSLGIAFTDTNDIIIDPSFL
jgi:hypothetical protein